MTVVEVPTPDPRTFDDTSRPAPSWSVRLFRGEILGIAVAAGAATGVVVVPLGRALVRRMREYNSARLRTLAELLALRAGDDA
ncbi:MAG: hypothetical protein ACREPM_08595 [Gemmatimonadaceae bacterium]